MIKGRAILIKKSNRNITNKNNATNSGGDLHKKRNRDNTGDSNNKEFDGRVNKKKTFPKESPNDELIVSDFNSNELIVSDFNSSNNDNGEKGIYNDNKSFMKKEEPPVKNNKKKDNDFFRKFLNK